MLSNQKYTKSNNITYNSSTKCSCKKCYAIDMMIQKSNRYDWMKCMHSKINNTCFASQYKIINEVNNKMQNIQNIPNTLDQIKMLNQIKMLDIIDGI